MIKHNQTQLNKMNASLEHFTSFDNKPVRLEHKELYSTYLLHDVPTDLYIDTP